jgi:hypothetical protein
VQPLDDLPAHRLGRGRRQRQQPRVSKLLDHRSHVQVVRAEVVAPLADAVRFINHEQGRPRLVQMRQHLLAMQLLGGEEDEFQLAVFQFIEGLALIGDADRGVDHRRPAHLLRLQRLGLIALERDQRRDHHRGAGDRHRGDLVDRRLAVAGGQHRQHVVSIEHGADGLFLPRPEGVDIEALARDPKQLGLPLFLIHEADPLDDSPI